jgi:hypothetical protein
LLLSFVTQHCHEQQVTAFVTVAVDAEKDGLPRHTLRDLEVVVGVFAESE